MKNEDFRDRNSNYLLYNTDRLKHELATGNPDYDNYRKNEWIQELIFNYDNKLKGSVYRASFVPFPEFSNPVYPHRFSYPDPKKGIPVNLGRANISGFPVCYVAESQFGAIVELILSYSKNNPTKDKWRTVYVSEWKVKPDLTCSIFKTKNRIPYGADGFSLNHLATFNYFMDLLEECYLVENAYSFSSKFSHQLLYDRGTNKLNIDLIQYPSVIDRKLCKELKINPGPGVECINYAIHPNFFDNNYDFIEVLALGIPNNFEDIIYDYFKNERMDLYFLGRGIVDKSSEDGRLCYQKT